jgi:hypothetical protein
MKSLHRTVPSHTLCRNRGYREIRDNMLEPDYHTSLCEVQVSNLLHGREIASSSGDDIARANQLLAMIEDSL